MAATHVFDQVKKQCLVFRHIIDVLDKSSEV